MELIAYIDPGSDDGLGLPVFLGVFVAVALWITLSFFVARYAEGKGQSFAGFLLLGILISPVLAAVGALLVGDRQSPGQGPTSPAPAGAAPDHLDRLKKLTELRDSGTLSPDEFDAEKAKILRN